MGKTFLRILIAASVISLACTTKVSEWVLLNALPNQYTLVYFHKDPLTENTTSRNRLVQTMGQANIEFRNVQRKDIDQPYWGLYYGSRLFARYNSTNDLRELASSPLREKIAGEIMTGKLCVLLYLKSGNTAKDGNGLQVINSALASSPYKDIITVVELDRNATGEKHFVSMLLNVEDDLRSIHEPMIFGIFGRFKALEPLLGKGITTENIRLMIDFLTADCSCLIKDNLPGVDILFNGKWENPATAMVNKILDENPSLLHH